jgi:outer membrane protein assembly factor BamB
MSKIQNRFYIFTVLLLVSFSNNTLANTISKVWEVDLSSIYKNPNMSVNFSPVISRDQLIFGNLKGEIKALDLKTRQIESIIKIPIAVERSLKLDAPSLKNYVVFSGKHLTNGKHYYCSIDIKAKKIKGVVAHDGGLFSFGEFALFEKNNSFIIFNPKEGRGVYRQKTIHKIEKSIFTQELNRYLFQSKNNQIIDVSIPKFGASIVMSKRNKEQNILNFRSIVTIDPDIIADNIDSEILYFHKENGIIGLLNIDQGSLVWEKQYFTKNKSIQGPYINNDILYYLVADQQDDSGHVGRIIALNKANGLSTWVSKDMPFKNFGIFHFDKYIISADLEGNLLFLNSDNGKLESKINIGAGITKPVIVKNTAVIMTDKKVILIQNNRLAFKFKLLLKQIKTYFT